MFDRPQTLAEAETRIRQTVTVEELLGLFAKCAEVMLLDLSTDEFLEVYDKAARIKEVVEDPKAPAYSKLEAYKAYELLHPDIRREVFPDVLEYDIKKIVSQARKDLEDNGFLLRGVISDELYEISKAVEVDKVVVEKIERARYEARREARLSDDEYYEAMSELRLMRERWAAGEAVYDREVESAILNRLKKRTEQHDLHAKRTVDDNLTDEQRDSLQNSKAREDRLWELKKEWFDGVKKNLLDESPVSAEDARQWVERSVSIPENLAKALARQGNYPLEKFKEDCAEFYRLVGGKMGMIEFGRDSKKDRAFQRGDIEVFMNGEINKRTLFHELSHVVEANSGFSGLCSKDFVRERATSDKPQRLNMLCPGFKYKNDEVAYPDNFIDPYVGKAYSDENATEVLSMGIERLTSPDLFYSFVMADGAHCNYILGVCTAREQFGRKRFEYTEREKAIKAANAHAKQLKKHFDSERRRIGYQSITSKLAAGGALIENHGISKTRKGYCVYEKVNGIGFARTSETTLPIAKLTLYFFAVREQIEPLHGKSLWDIFVLAVDFSKGLFPAWFTENTTLPSLDL